VSDTLDDLVSTIASHQRHQRFREDVNREVDGLTACEIRRVGHKKVDMASDRFREWIEEIPNQNFDIQAGALYVV
jgi:hypothetical protein